MTRLSRADLEGSGAAAPGDPAADDKAGEQASPARPKGADGARLPFRLVVEWAQAITARSVTMVGGRWEQGTFYPGEQLQVIRASSDGAVSHRVLGTHIDAVGAIVGAGQPPGIRFGVVVEGIRPAEISAGDILQALS